MTENPDMPRQLSHQEESWVPGKEWTQEDRIKVVVSITNQMLNYPMSLARRNEVQEWAKKIESVLIKSPEFLEANKENILKGLTFKKRSNTVIK